MTLTGPWTGRFDHLPPYTSTRVLPGTRVQYPGTQVLGTDILKYMSDSFIRASEDREPIVRAIEGAHRDAMVCTHSTATSAGRAGSAGRHARRCPPSQLQRYSS